MLAWRITYNDESNDYDEDEDDNDDAIHDDFVDDDDADNPSGGRCLMDRSLFRIVGEDFGRGEHCAFLQSSTHDTTHDNILTDATPATLTITVFN